MDFYLAAMITDFRDQPRRKTWRHYHSSISWATGYPALHRPTDSFGILAAAETPDMPRHDKVGPISEDHLDVATMGNIYTLQRQHSGLLEESTDPRLCLS